VLMMLLRDCRASTMLRRQRCLHQRTQKDWQIWEALRLRTGGKCWIPAASWERRLQGSTPFTT
jgi:hypothetical protein